ncbi:hypothetical protein [Kitasatospora sp. MY 5-36]|uniref:hypothetical protein n=1 Tax=Kitasatospora sp. MY 5-36 TaxID=1678027 RepID=UPI0006712A86|nr:hypothetical protein [Kitasatospora sp. MY 5-36]
MPLSDDQPRTRTRLPVGEQSSPQQNHRQSRPLRALLAVLVVVTLLVVAIAIANRVTPGSGSGTGGGASADRAGSGAGPAPSGDQPVGTTVNGIPTGYPHTEPGAQSAATNYAVAIGSADMFRTDSRHGIIATIADPGALAGLQGRLDQGFSPETAARFGVDTQGQPPKGLTFVSRTIPVGTKSSGYTADGVKVDVWCTGLFGLAGERSTKPVSEEWFTLTLSLRWTGSDWKLSDYSRVSGPAPIPPDQQAATAEEITGAVEQFGGFHYAR